MLTNKFGYPEEVVRALTKNRYKADDETQDLKTDFSITTLISPVQQTILKRRYPNCKTEDVSERLFSLLGSLCHDLLEEHGSDDSVTEKRFYANVQGKVVSGQVDHYKDGIITDYKFTKTWKITSKSFDDWTAQLNCYDWLVRNATGEISKELRIIAILRDRNDDIEKEGYPESDLVIVPIPKWSKGEQQFFIDEKVAKLTYNEKLSDNELLPCTDEEMWIRDSKWAIMKDGRKTAVRVFDDYQNAEKFYRAAPEKERVLFTIIERKGVPKRCNKYCSVAPKCNQYQEYLKREKYVRDSKVV